MSFLINIFIYRGDPILIMLWFIFITFWYDKVSIKINKSISYEQAPLLFFKMSSVTLVNFTATSQSASHSYHIIKCSLCLVLLQYAPYYVLGKFLGLIGFRLGTQMSDRPFLSLIFEFFWHVQRVNEPFTSIPELPINA